jgi:hypothetical protein
MTTLEERFIQIMGNVDYQVKPTPVMRPVTVQQASHNRTVYSVGEAINQRGQDAKLGASSNRNPSTRR